MHKNILIVVGITILFLGVAINPAIAINPNTSDSEEDCNLCPKVSEQHLVLIKSLLNRVETLNTKLSIISKQNPIIEKKYQELSERITTLTEINKEYVFNLSWGFPILCAILTIIYVSSVVLMMLLSMIYYTVFLPWGPIIKIFLFILPPIVWSLRKIGNAFGCWDLQLVTSIGVQLKNHMT